LRIGWIEFRLPNANAGRLEPVRGKKDLFKGRSPPALRLSASIGSCHSVRGAPNMLSVGLEYTVVPQPPPETGSSVEG
jgi:hypothetical protein